MLVDNINDFSLQKIPKKIEKELKFLKDDVVDMLRDGHLCWEYEGRIDDLRAGLVRLKERWIEYVNEKKPSSESVKEPELQLQECAKLVDQLKKLSLHPPIPQPQKEKSISLTESRDDIFLFASEEQKQQATKEALQKLDDNAANRDLWIAQGSNKLSMCMCGPKLKRVENELDFLRALIKRYPPHPSFELCLMSVGSGKLLQDWVLLQQLAEIGYSKIYLHLVDPLTTEGDVVVLRALIDIYLKNSITIIHTQCKPEHIEECRPFHAIYAMDLDPLSEFPEAEEVWYSLTLASDCLKERGLIFCSFPLGQCWFDAQDGQWKLPDPQIDISERQFEEHKLLSFAVTDDEHFWQSTLYYLAKLSQLKKNIVVRIIKTDASAVINTIDVVLAKKILAPRGEMDLTVEYSSEKENAPFDVLFVYKRLIDESFLDQCIPQIRERGIIILDPHSYWRKEDNTLKKGRLCAQVCKTIKSVKEYANDLALSRSLQINWCL